MGSVGQREVETRALKQGMLQQLFISRVRLLEPEPTVARRCRRSWSGMAPCLTQGTADCPC